MMICFVEDELVSLDELQEQVAEFEDYVQSSDVAAMQSPCPSWPFLRLMLTLCCRALNSKPRCILVGRALVCGSFYCNWSVEQYIFSAVSLGLAKKSSLLRLKRLDDRLSVAVHADLTLLTACSCTHRCWLLGVVSLRFV